MGSAIVSRESAISMDRFLVIKRLRNRVPTKVRPKFFASSSENELPNNIFSIARFHSKIQPGRELLNSSSCDCYLHFCLLVTTLFQARI